MSIQITLDQRKVREIENFFSSTPLEAKKELAKIINKGARRGRERAASDLRTIYAVDRSAVQTDFKTVTATSTNLRAILSSSGKPLSLIKFNAYPKSPKPGAVVAANVLRANAPKLFPHAFVARMSSNGHTNIFTRVGKSRFPIKGFWGPSVPSMYRNKEVVNNMEQAIQEKIDEELDDFFNRLLRG